MAGSTQTRRRRRTPVVLQMEAAECGAAALTMIMNRYGRDVDLEEVREACAVSRDGVNAGRILRAARQYGFTGKGYAAPAGKILESEQPFIVFWQNNHFLVVDEVGDKKIVLNDPASGRRTVTREEFNDGYSGAALRIEPGEDFEPDPERHKRGPVRELFALLAHSRTGLAYAIIAGLLVVVPTTAASLLVALFATEVLTFQNTNVFTTVIVLAVLVALLTIGLSAIQQLVLVRLRARLSIRLSAEYVRRLFQLPISFYAARSEGGLASRAQMIPQLATLLSGHLATVAVGLVTMVLFAGVLLRLNLILGGIAIAIALLNAAALVAVARSRIASNQSLQQQDVALFGTTYVGMFLIDDIRATGAENEFFARWTGTQTRLLNTEQRLGYTTQSLLSVPVFLTTLNTVAILFVGGLLVLRGNVSLAQLIAVNMLSGSFLAPMNSTIASLSQFQDARAWSQQINDVLRATPDVRAARAAPALTGETPEAEDRELPAERLRGRLEFRDVTFGYVSTEPPLIEDFSLSLEPGARVALVGATGSGKSTVAKLAAGLYRPRSGQVLLDGRPFDDVAPEVVGASLAKVDQSIQLFRGTIADNIRFWDDRISADEVVAAASDAAIKDEISAMPGGFSHELSEGGRNLSGGQRQRIEIARALAIDPRILILDEATSALDTLTERAIDASLRRRGCTCLIVAHRLSTIRDCDEIVVLDGGRVVERGTHEELLALAGHYAGLVAHE